jgi:malonate-semialdehyde dehydrogenase (acetylating)/methylmalonate-semialdehyde dehydrogenase
LHLVCTANQLTAAGFGSAGQRCMAITVVVAVSDVADELVERVRDRQGAGGQGRSGPGAGLDMGPVITETAPPAS